MKKIVALLLIIGCLVTISSLSVGAVSTGNDVDLIVKANGESITVDVETDFACGSLQGALLYDSDEITYSKTSFATPINSKNKVADSIKNVKNATKFAFVGNVNTGTTGNWATISFNGKTPKFNVSNLKAYSANGNKIDADVYVVFRGDANVDGNLDIRDLVALKDDTNIKEIYVKNTDVDKDGALASENDMATFKKYLLGLYKFN